MKQEESQKNTKDISVNTELNYVYNIRKWIFFWDLWTMQEKCMFFME